MDVDELHPHLFADHPVIDETEYPPCASCGTTLTDLYNHGLMGCHECYRVFGDVARRALVVIHGTSRHTGKSL